MNGPYGDFAHQQQQTVEETTATVSNNNDPLSEPAPNATATTTTTTTKAPPVNALAVLNEAAEIIQKARRKRQEEGAAGRRFPNGTNGNTPTTIKNSMTTTGNSDPFGSILAGKDPNKTPSLLVATDGSSQSDEDQSSGSSAIFLLQRNTILSPIPRDRPLVYNPWEGQDPSAARRSTQIASEVPKDDPTLNFNANGNTNNNAQGSAEDGNAVENQEKNSKNNGSSIGQNNPQGGSARSTNNDDRPRPKIHKRQRLDVYNPWTHIPVVPHTSPSSTTMNAQHVLDRGTSNVSGESDLEKGARISLPLSGNSERNGLSPTANSASASFGGRNHDDNDVDWMKRRKRRNVRVGIILLILAVVISATIAVTFQFVHRQKDDTSTQGTSVPTNGPSTPSPSPAVSNVLATPMPSLSGSGEQSSPPVSSPTAAPTPSPSFGPSAVFEWTQIGVPFSGNEENEFLGSSIALAASYERRLAVGSHRSTFRNDTHTLQNAGSVKILANTIVRDRWILLPNVVRQIQEGDFFGKSVALSANGNILAIGAPQTLNTHADATGFVRVYQYELRATWLPTGQILRGQQQGDCFGESISFSDDGQYLAIGAPTKDRAGYVQVYHLLFARNHWEQRGNDLVGETDGDRFGSFVSLAREALVIAVGSPGYDNDAGRAAVYEFRETQWEPMGQGYFDGPYANAELGQYVGLSEQGSVLSIASWSLDSVVNNGRSGSLGNTNDSILNRNNSTASDNATNSSNSNNSTDIVLPTRKIQMYQYDANTDAWIPFGLPVLRRKDNNSTTTTATSNTTSTDGSSSSSLLSSSEYINTQSTALDRNGQVLAVGSPHFQDTGRVELLQYDGPSDAWRQLSVPLLGETALEQTGQAISMLNEPFHRRVTIAISAPMHSGNEHNHSGQVRVYQTEY